MIKWFGKKKKNESYTSFIKNVIFKRYICNKVAARY